MNFPTLDALLKEYQAIQQKAPTGTVVGPQIHGLNGLFGVPGLARDVINSRMSTRGLASEIPAIGSVYMNPLFPYITGITEPNGTQTEIECADGPTAGNFKTCIQTAQFGIYKFRTRELNIATVGNLVNHGEFTDLRFVGDPLAGDLANMFSPNLPKDQALRYGREVLTRFVEVGIAFQNLLSQQLFVGTGAGNEFRGLEGLVIEDHVDAQTQQVCKALDSDVRDFGDVDITTASGAAAIVTQLTDMFRMANYHADRMGLSPVQFAFVMKYHAFVELTDIWPCSYMTNRCNLDSTNKTVFVSADDQLQMRLAMRQGSYLMIDDQPVPVITDDALPETDLGELVFSSDIYLLPMSIQGGRPVLYWEYFDFSEGTVPSIRDGRATDDFWTDRGVYLWHKQPPLNGCIIWQAETKMRVRLETPQIAGRLQNVAYSVNKHYRNTIPGQDYYLNGGVSTGYPYTVPYKNW